MLSLSIDKTCYSVFGATDKTNIKLKLGDTTLKQEECSKYLGVIIDSNLTRQNHIDYIYNKIIKFVGIFYRIRHKLNFEMAKMVYFAFVHSYLIYGIEIYGNTFKNHLSKLMILNNKTFAFTTKSSHRYTYNTVIYKFQYNAFT